MNEEMYEEEDDDIPWRYRNVTSHLPLEDGLLSRRLQSMLAVQLEHQRLLGQAVNSTLQHNPQLREQDFRNQQFVSPNMMQMPQASQNSMMPPQQLNRSPTSYRHSPYPMQQAKPQYHQRSASVATPQEWASNGQHQQPALAPATTATDERRMSLPQNGMQPVQRTSSYQSNLGSIPTSPVSTYQTDQQYNQSINNALGPFTTNLSMDTQQLLAGSETFPAFPPTFDLFGDSVDYPQKSQQPFYSYKPNASSGGLKGAPSTSVGLDQTLLGTSIDANLDCNAFAETPNPANSGYLNSAVTEPGYGFSFDGSMGSMFGLDPFASGGNSGQITPGNLSGYSEPMFNDFLEQDMYGDVQTAS